MTTKKKQFFSEGNWNPRKAMSEKYGIFFMHFV